MIDELEQAKGLLREVYAAMLRYGWKDDGLLQRVKATGYSARNDNSPAGTPLAEQPQEKP